MSALRQLIAAIWAAVWLRGRLLGLKARRLFGGRGSAAEAGSDYRLFAGDAPVEGVDYDPLELPAELAARLEVTRAELVDHAHAAAAAEARSRPARRRRSASIAVAAVLGLGVVSAGASALVSGTTGVPAIDRLLGVYEDGLSKPGVSDRPGPSGGDLQPGPSKASEPIETTLPDGSKSTTSFYVARDGKICWAVAVMDGSGSGGLSCEAPGDVANGMRDGGYVPGFALGAHYVVLRGYVSGDVVGLSGRGPGGSLDIQLGERWTPSSTPAVGELKPFVAVGAYDPEALDASEQQRVLQLQSYEFDAVAEDGRQSRIMP